MFRFGLVSGRCNLNPILFGYRVLCLQGRLSGTSERVFGLDKHGARAVGERTVRQAVAGRRAVRVAGRVRGTRGSATADGRCSGDHAVQTEHLRARHGVLGEPRVSHRIRVQAVPVRAGLQGGRGVALPVARRLLRPHTHVQRPKGLRENMPVHQEGHRKVSASAVFANTVLLVGRQANR